METGDDSTVDKTVILGVISEVTRGTDSIKLVTDVLYKLLMNAGKLITCTLCSISARTDPVNRGASDL